MIIKSSRVRTERTAAIARYLTARGTNERITWQSGSPEDMQIMGEISKLAGKSFSVRHVVISPGEKTSNRDLVKILREICLEYNVPSAAANRLCVVKHQKARTGSDLNVHWHVALAETDTISLRTMESSFSRIRDEKLSRIAELVLGHSVTPGRFNKEIYQTLSRERKDLDLEPFRQALQSECRRAGLEYSNWLYVRRIRKMHAPQSDPDVFSTPSPRNILWDMSPEL